MSAIALDLSDLLRWARYMEDVGEVTGPAAVKALNDFGERLAINKAEQIAEKTGLEPADVLDGSDIFQADLNNPEWSFDATALGPVASPNWQRPWQTRGNSYEQEKLESIITRADCCELCERIAEEGPYTVAQINDMASKYANYVPPLSVIEAQGLTITGRTHLLHPNCFCATKPWRSYRRGVEAFSGGHSLGRVTPNQLAKMIGDEITLALRSKKK